MAYDCYEKKYIYKALTENIILIHIREKIKHTNKV